MKRQTTHSFSLICLLLMNFNLYDLATAQDYESLYNKTTTAQDYVSLYNKTIFDVGVILDLGSSIGKICNVCISLSMKDHWNGNGSNSKMNLRLHLKDSNDSIVEAASKAKELLQNDMVKAIIGPQTSAQAQFIAELGDEAQVPVISFSATSPLVSPNLKPYFIRTAINDSSQVRAIATLIQAFEWQEVICIYEDTIGNGIGFLPDLTDALVEFNARVVYKSVMSHFATDDGIINELSVLVGLQSRVFVVHLSPSLSSRLFLQASKKNMMTEGYVWIVTDAVANHLDSMNSSVIQCMQGVLGARPYVPESQVLKSFKERYKREYLRLNANEKIDEPNIYGFWAYDTIWALAIAAEKSVGDDGSTLRDAILGTNFNGLSGYFNLTGGQFEPSVFEIVNVVEKRAKGVGFWTPANGLANSNTVKKSTYSTSKEYLKQIKWPGTHSRTTPKGWVVIGFSRKKCLMIGVPKKRGFSEFVNATLDPKTNESNVSGFSIDVFKAAIRGLPYAVNHVFIPYMDKFGNSSGSYDDLIYQVYLKEFDAVVGDTTIIYNRSLSVDFTMPYTESGVTLVVLANRRGSRAWIFLKPLSWELWLMTVVGFVFTGLVVWSLEHRINAEFRGSPAQQVGISLWFSFSTLVFAHRERVVSNLTRFVVIIWVFVVLILSSSYTASLTALLTAEQLQPPINDINDLIKNGDNVGYQTDTFVVDYLKALKVDSTKIKDYGTPEQFAEALDKGTHNGGVGGIMDEIPYLKRFLAMNRNCAKYKMVGPIYRTGGFGFVFPKGSPLVPDLSRQILNLTEGEEIKKIEKEWIGLETSCPDQSTTVASNSLNLKDFWGLFLITGAASTSALIISFFSFLCKEGSIMIDRECNPTFSQRLGSLLRRFLSAAHPSPSSTSWRSAPNDALAMLPANVHESSSPATSDNNNNSLLLGDLTTNRLASVDDGARQMQPLNSERLARRRWNLLRDRYVHV